MKRTIVNVALVGAATLALAACDENNPFRNTTPGVSSGTDQVWELALAGFPSGWAFSTGERFFVGTSATPSNGAFVLDAGDGGALVFRPFSDLAPGQAAVRTDVQDLTVTRGSTTFESVTTVPEGGYEDTAEVVEGHVYAFRLASLGTTLVPLNYAKLEVIDVDREVAGDAGSRFVVFRWAYQRQPLNRNVQISDSE